jgi:hypothetical protein
MLEAVQVCLPRAGQAGPPAFQVLRTDFQIYVMLEAIHGYVIVKSMEKNPHAVALGRLGGRAGGHRGGVARARALTPERRREIARQAAEARWSTSPAGARGGEAPGRGVTRARAREALELPAAVARLLRTYEVARLRWDEPSDRWAIVAEVLVRGDAEARQWLATRLDREGVRELVRQFRGAGLAEPERARLRAELGLDENDLPVRAFLGHAWGGGGKP